MKVSWDDYQIFRDCPQKYSWMNTKGQLPGNFLKDDQYLIKGLAIQEVLSSYFSALSLDFSNRGVLDSSLSVQLLDRLRYHHLNKTGFCKKSVFDLCEEILPTIKPSIDLILDIATSEGSLARIETEKDLNTQYHLENVTFNITSRADFLFTNISGESILVEGKNTKYPNKADREQLYWYVTQIRTLGYKVRAAYFCFYTFGKLEYIPLESVDEWILKRDCNLKRMFSGFSEALPSREVCRLCKYKFMCPYSYKEPEQTTVIGNISIL